MLRFSISFFFICLAFSTVFHSCKSENNKVTNTAKIQEVKKKEIFPAGKIIDKIKCINDTSLNYSLYLPTGYNENEGDAYPVVFVFDPHGDGKLPLKNYSTLAEKYQFILAGSNNSKNGLPLDEIQKIVTYFLSDVPSRFQVNPQRIYTLGFSGGARIANTITMSNSSITGTICCGAAVPAATPANMRDNYFFMAITGNEDFNYTEIKNYERTALQNKNIQHFLLTFDGKHEWPPVNTMDEAFWWMELNNMRKNPSTRNDTLISKQLEKTTEELKTALNKKNHLLAYEICNKAIHFYEDLDSIPFFLTTYKQLQTNKELNNIFKKEQETELKEEQLKQKYIAAIQEKNISWWMQEIKLLQQKAKSSSTDEAFIYKRTLSFLSLLMYMQTTQLLQQNNIAAANHFSMLYLLVDPDNTEAHYLAAEINALEGNASIAIASLKKALSKGFTDTTRLLKDEAFKELQFNADFRNLVLPLLKQ